MHNGRSSRLHHFPVFAPLCFIEHVPCGVQPTILHARVSCPEVTRSCSCQGPRPEPLPRDAGRTSCPATLIVDPLTITRRASFCPLPSALYKLAASIVDGLIQQKPLRIAMPPPFPPFQASWTPKTNKSENPAYAAKLLQVPTHQEPHRYAAVACMRCATVSCRIRRGRRAPKSHGSAAIVRYRQDEMNPGYVGTHRRTV